jgi:hypothetical protein
MASARLSPRTFGKAIVAKLQDARDAAAIC